MKQERRLGSDQIQTFFKLFSNFFWSWLLHDQLLLSLFLLLNSLFLVWALQKLNQQLVVIMRNFVILALVCLVIADSSYALRSNVLRNSRSLPHSASSSSLMETQAQASKDPNDLPQSVIDEYDAAVLKSAKKVKEGFQGYTWTDMAHCVRWGMQVCSTYFVCGSPLLSSLLSSPLLSPPLLSPPPLSPNSPSRLPLPLPLL
jgi:hypothetical protein